MNRQETNPFYYDSDSTELEYSDCESSSCGSFHDAAADDFAHSSNRMDQVKAMVKQRREQQAARGQQQQVTAADQEEIDLNYDYGCPIVKALRAANIHYCEGIDNNALQRANDQSQYRDAMVPGNLPVFMQQPYFSSHPKSSSVLSDTTEDSGESVDDGYSSSDVVVEQRAHNDPRGTFRALLGTIVTVPRYMTPKQVYLLKKKEKEARKNITPK